MSWINEEIVDITKHKAIVYIITNNITNEKYIGKKNLFSKTSKKVKNRVNKKWTIKETNWKDYQSSSDDVKKWDNVTKEILRACEFVGEATYIETKLLFEYDVLNIDNSFVNKNISGKFFKSY